eukprot:TRINITY_DN25319_c0_g1_i1.p1 TRINITY_DN25319_c0_g1~~TRINITY_DN25319_c0_g1_i1.p1  ORF type:complete len:464 (+),score=72.89 TRINITY_DN25319_c0_g1_i1:31-1422(+)
MPDRLPVQVAPAEFLGFALGVFILLTEVILRTIALILPLGPVFRLLGKLLTGLAGRGITPATPTKLDTTEALCTMSTPELLEFRGYPVEDHVVRTQDGFLLVLHRIPHGQAPPDSSQKRPVVFLMHGFMMNSEIWVVQTDASHCLAMLLADAGYDVWLGNSRGNKYSHKHVWYKATEDRFWDFSIDELAMFDMPAAVEYVLRCTGQQKLSIVGFSQGSAQVFAGLSVNHQLCQRVNLFIGLAPTATVKSFGKVFGEFLVDPLAFSSTLVLFFLFGRRKLLSATLIWQRLLSRRLYVHVLDWWCWILFDWRGKNMGDAAKRVYYSHLYSYTSVKVMLHWLQILRSKRFAMFEDDYNSSHLSPAYPLRQISCPVALFYGGADNLPDIDFLRANLKPVFMCEVPGYEHLDFLWAHNANEKVYGKVLELIGQHSHPAAGSWENLSDLALLTGGSPHCQCTGLGRMTQ